jgi:predicted nuclease of predicted toxin-antitoxin system
MASHCFPTPSADSAICAAVFDLDNMLHRGFDKKGRALPQAELDVVGLASMLREHGVTCGTVCRNRQFPPLAAALWQRLGFQTVSVGANVDEVAMAEAERWATAGAKRVVLLTGDSDFAGVVARLRQKGVGVEIVARTVKCSKRLRALASQFTALDRFVRPPSQLLHS